ncbi:MAG TPA: DUF4198 domain-containing protein [Novosphingobium sp.]
MLKKTILLAAAAMCAVASPAFAHRAWLLPSATTLANTSQSVTVDAGASTEPFNADHAPMNVDTVQAWAPDGTMGKIENVSRGRYRSTFDVAIDKPGTWRIGTATTTVSGTFKLNGEPWAVGRARRGGGGAPGAGGMGGAGGPAAAKPAAAGGAVPAPANPPRPRIDPSHVVATVADIPAGATDLALTESQSRNEFFVTAGAPTDTLFKPANKGLEMVPVTPPTDLVANEPGKFRFLVDGKPAAGLKVEVVPGGQRFRDAEHAQELTTDADGVLTVAWPIAAYYWLSTDLTDDKPGEAKAAKRRLSYTATVEVVAP